MKKMCLLLALLISCGCAHKVTEQAKQDAPAARPELSTGLVERTIVKGKTTKKDVMARLGVPNSITPNVRRKPAPAPDAPLIDRTAEVWNYWTVPPVEAINKVGGQAQIFRLTVSFDDKGVVLDYQAEERTVTNLP